MTTPNLSRRVALRLGLGAAGAFAFGCYSDSIVFPSRGGSPRLAVLPHSPSQSVEFGATSVDVGDSLRDIRLYVPATYMPSVPAPLVVIYHPTGANAESTIGAFSAYADAGNFILLAFSAFSGTWDAVIAKFGHDVTTTNLARDATFSRCNIDPARIGTLGVSSGATYSLAMGMANGDVFSRVACFFPGNIIGVPEVGKPEMFISHGVFDQIYTIDSASRPIVKELQKRHYEVDYREFSGGHTIHKPHLDIAMPWLAAAR